MIPTELQNAPASVLDIFNQAGGAKDPQKALRMVRLAGWYRTKGGWKQLTQDLRNKVAIREAEKQPDGTYVIPDVDVFYPNAVKADGQGRPLMFDADRNRRIIANTNAQLKTGGFRPALTRMHYTQGQKDNGIKLPVCGRAVNFRETPGKAGWVRCDLVDVDANTKREWEAGQITGLSAGFCADAGGSPNSGKLNERIDHVAALGNAQALAHLPVTEVFSVTNQLCFSADSTYCAGATFTGDSSMPKNIKNFCAKMGPSHGALQAAYAAVEAGEPGAEDKLKQAHEAHFAAQQEVSGDAPEGHPDAEQDNALVEKLLAEKGGGMDGEPATGAAAPMYDADAIDFAADPQAAFEALKATTKQMAARIANFEAEKAATTAELAKAKTQTARQQFQAHLTEMAGKGHQFDADSILATFDAADGNVKVIDSLKAQLAKTPTTPQLSQEKMVFGADGIIPDRAAKAVKEELAKASTNVSGAIHDYAQDTSFDAAGLAFVSK